jgi:hypothetical protein
MSGYDLTVDFSTIEAAGEHAEEIDANATGTITIQATDPTVLRRTLTGDVTLHVAGAPTPGKGWSTELRTTQDGTGGRDLTILPANLVLRSSALNTSPNTPGAGGSLTLTVTEDDLSILGGHRSLCELAVTGSGTSSASVTQSLTPATTTGVLACLAKAGASDVLSLAFNPPGGGGSDRCRAYFNLATGVVGASGALGSASGVTAGLTELADEPGVYLCFLKGTVSTVSPSLTVFVGLASDAYNDTAVAPGDSIFVGAANYFEGSDLVGLIEVGATRAASVVWRGGAAAEIDYAAQAAAAESRIIIGVGSDGEILIDDVSVEA